MTAPHPTSRPTRRPTPRSVVVIAGTTWSGHNRRAVVELSRAMAARSRVLFVENPPPASRRDWPGRSGRLQRLSASLSVLTPPPAAPANRLPPGRLHRAVMGRNRRRLAGVVQRAVGLLQLSDPVLLNAWNPTYGLDLIRASRTAYFCYDDIGAATWKARHGAAAERALLPAADRVIATSPALASYCRQLNPQTHLVPNGVDFAAYRAEGPPHPLTTGGRTLGYVGSIDHRVDVDLLTRLADAVPESRLLLVGQVFPSAGDLSALSRRPNVTLAGPVPAEAVPSVLRGLSVGLIPFRRTRFTASVCPLKVYEYLAAGLPVVSTDFAPIDDARDVIVQTGDPERFIAQARAALAAPGGTIADRLAVAAAADWTVRAEQLLAAMTGPVVR